MNNLTFASCGLSFGLRQNLYNYSLNERDDHISYESMLGREYLYRKFLDYYLAIREKNVIANTQDFGCYYVKLTDPLWHVRKYHCYTGYAVSCYDVLIINKRTTRGKQFVFLRLIIRGMVEGHLARRTNRFNSNIYHLESMAADLFESHEATTLDVIKLFSMKGIFLDTLTLHGIIVMLVTCRILFYFIKKIMSRVCEELRCLFSFAQSLYLAAKWHVTNCISDNKVHPV